MRRVNMKNFRVQIHYNGHRAETNVMAEDSASSIEQAIIDKLGEKSIKWENLGNAYQDQKRITYEEVIDDTRTIQYKTVLGVRMAKRAPEGREA